MVYKNNKRNFISLFLILSIILSWVCFDSSNAELSFLRQISSETATTLSTDNKISASPEVSIEELIGQRVEISYARHSGNFQQKTGSRIHFFIPGLQIIPQLNFFIHSVVAVFSHNIIFSNAVIIDYIHQKDGKK